MTHRDPRKRISPVIYLNNAGTSWPKPDAVHEAAARTLRASPSESTPLLDETRAETATFLGIPDPSRLIFTTGCTAALNLILRDFPWKEDDIALTSGLEHHALLRPLLQDPRIRLETAPYSPEAPFPIESAEAALRGGRVRLIACTMASNVTGDLLSVRELAALAHRYGARMLVDAAQTVGVVPVNAADLGADFLVFAGHKGPLAPLGIGGLYVAPDVALECPAATCDLGASAAKTVPFPTYCDVGSVNLPALAGLQAGLRWIRERKLEVLTEQLRTKTARFRAGLAEIEGITIYGSRLAERRTGAVSITSDRKTPDDLERGLLARGIEARAGFHCAPKAHETLRTQGTLRFSFGPFNTEGDVDAALAALREEVHG